MYKITQKIKPETAVIKPSENVWRGGEGGIDSERSRRGGSRVKKMCKMFFISL